MTETGRLGVRLKVSGAAGNAVAGSARQREKNPDLRLLASLRQETYQLLSVALLYPTEDVASTLAESAASLLRRERWAAQLGFYAPWDRFLRAIDDSVGNLQRLQESYLALFSGSTLRPPVPLNECAYLTDPAKLSGQVIADLETQYGSMGMSVSPSKAEGPDHAAVEMAFVSFLSSVELSSWEAEDPIGALRLMNRQRRFLKQHPCQWFPHLSRALEARDDATLYTLAAHAAQAMAAHDVDFLKAMSDYMRAADPDGTRDDDKLQT